MDRWAGKVAVVTGASVGIGAAISQALVKKSVKVVGLARREEKLQELTNQLGKHKFFGVVCDLRSEADIVKAFNWVQENLGGADILINNAGVSTGIPVIDSDLDEYRKILDTNVIAPAITAREFVKSAKKRNISGHIINISSIAGHNAEIVQLPIGMYAASKYALTALAVELRHELGNTDIKVTNVSPGAVATDMLKDFLGNPDLFEKIPSLSDDDVSDAVMYALGTPPNVEVIDLLIAPRSSTSSLLEVRRKVAEMRNK
ncbi:farnesol dehydrogenase-like [Lasioglossum baleicum]|uniref:farnesol dehydrogenase-like n=1 Tax=Lasioglossum baleicum TaxID=434251 RepID=UPI003FCE965A